MRKSSSNDGTPPVNIISAAASELIFIPTPSQRQVKARLVIKLAENPIIELGSLTLAEAQQLTGSSQLKDWWGRPGFKEWFLDQNEYRQRLEYLFSLALDAAEEILLSTDIKVQGARVAMIKLLAELANKTPKEAQTRYKDEAIAKMSQAELEAFLEKNGIAISGQK
jgi:hypothetical protein